MLAQSKHDMSIFLKRKTKCSEKKVIVNITKELIEQLMHWSLSGFNKLQECIIIVILFVN